MSKQNSGGPFHPTGNIIRLNGAEIDHEIIPGASLRAWLAGLAMQGLVTASCPNDYTDDDFSSGHTAAATRRKLWKAAIALADDGIAELEKEIT